MRVKIKLNELTAFATVLKQYRDRIPDQAKQISLRAVEAGVMKAEENFANVTDYQGNYVPNDVSVYIEETAKGHKIVASGKDVLFAEFGAGVYNENYPDQSIVAKQGFERGEFGKGKGKQPLWNLPKGADGIELANGRVVSFGNNPARGLYEAEKVMRRELKDMARKAVAK